MTYEHIGESFHAAWYEPAAVAERAAKREELHRFFDGIRDKVRAAAEAEETNNATGRGL